MNLEQNCSEPSLLEAITKTTLISAAAAVGTMGGFAVFAIVMDRFEQSQFYKKHPRSKSK
jgi:hypothetical protein